MALGKTPNSRLKPFFRRLGPEFDAFARRGTTLVHKPVEHIVGGFTLEPTSRGTECRHLSFFAMPLYVPCEFVALSFGHRIPKNTNPKGLIDSFTVNVVDTETGSITDTIRVMLEEGLPQLMPMLTLEGFYAYLLNRKGPIWQPHRYEALIYTAILLEMREAALQHIEDGLKYFVLMYGDLDNPLEPIKRPAPTLIARFRMMRDHLERGDQSAAKDQLAVWRHLTIEALIINDLCVS
jgi:hypothetical protein